MLHGGITTCKNVFEGSGKKNKKKVKIAKQKGGSAYGTNEEARGG